MSAEINYIRPTVCFTNPSFGEMILEYAKSEWLKEIRFCITQNFRNASELPYEDFTLLQNAPLMQAIIILNMPGFEAPFVIVHDYPGMTTRRDGEVKTFITNLLALDCKKIFYAVDPAPVTIRMSVEDAGKSLINLDYTALSESTLNNFLNRMW